MKKHSSVKHYKLSGILFWLCFLVIAVITINLFRGQNMDVPDIGPIATITSSQVEHPISTGVYSAVVLGIWPATYGNDWHHDDTAAGMTALVYQYVYGYNYKIYRFVRGMCMIIINLLALFLNFSFAAKRRKFALPATISMLFLVVNFTACCCPGNRGFAQSPQVRDGQTWQYNQPIEMRIYQIDHKSDAAKIEPTRETVLDPAVDKPSQHLDMKKVQWKEPEKKEVERKEKAEKPTIETLPLIPVQAKDTQTVQKAVTVAIKPVKKNVVAYKEITLQYEMVIYDGKEKSLPEGSIVKLNSLTADYKKIALTPEGKNSIIRIIGHATGENNRKLAGLRIQVAREIIEQGLPDKLKRNIEMINLDDAMPVYRADGKTYADCVEIVVLTRSKPQVD